MIFIFRKEKYGDRFGGYIKIGFYTKKSYFHNIKYWDHPVILRIPFYKG